MNFNINLNENQINTLVQQVVLFISFILIAYGSSLIHHGLLWIVLGIFTLRYSVSLDRMISVFITIPTIPTPNCNCDKKNVHIDDSDMNIIEDIFKNKSDESNNDHME